MWTGRVVHNYEAVCLQTDQVRTARRHDRRLRHRRRLIHRYSHRSRGKSSSVQSSELTATKAVYVDLLAVFMLPVTGYFLLHRVRKKESIEFSVYNFIRY